MPYVPQQEPERKLSFLLIDVDKGWETHGITNIKELADSMSRGDILIRDTNVITKLSPGAIGCILTSQGEGIEPHWAFL